MQTAAVAGGLGVGTHGRWPARAGAGQQRLDALALAAAGDGLIGQDLARVTLGIFADVRANAHVETMGPGAAAAKDQRGVADGRQASMSPRGKMAGRPAVMRVISRSGPTVTVMRLAWPLVTPP